MRQYGGADVVEVDGGGDAGRLEQVPGIGPRFAYSASLRSEHLKWI
jgi:hypothetical protein